jgi:uncharacterized membrane protein HdeD (DUF308 family)
MIIMALYVDTGIVQVVGEFVRQQQDAAFWPGFMMLLSRIFTVRPASCL